MPLYKNSRFNSNYCSSQSLNYKYPIQSQILHAALGQLLVQASVLEDNGKLHTCIHPVSMPRFTRLVLDEMIGCLGGRPVPTLNTIYDFRGSPVNMEAITLTSFPVHREARLLSYVFVTQGVNATIASGRVQNAPYLVDPIEHGMHPTYEDGQVMIRFCDQRFDTDSSIGPNSDLSKGLLGWWGYNYGFIPGEQLTN